MLPRSAVDLIAVQARMEWADYVRPGAFEAKIDSFVPAVKAARASAGHPAVVVFPEDIGLFLVAVGAERALESCKTTDEAFNRLALKHAPAIAWAMVRRRVTNPKAAFWLARAGRVHEIMVGAFSRFARETGAHVVAGSAALPRNAHGLVLRPFAPAGREVFNLSYTFGPTGELLAETAKVNLVPTMEDTIGLSPGSAARVPAVDAGGFKVATAICYDGFRCAHSRSEPGFTPLLPILDRMGVEIVAQPSANPWPWEDRWIFAEPGDDRLRKEQWLGEGAHSLLAQLDKVTYIVNPQLVAGFLDVHFEGRSFIFAREGGEVRTLAEARTTGAEEIIHARVIAGDHGDHNEAAASA